MSLLKVTPLYCWNFKSTMFFDSSRPEMSDIVCSPSVTAYRLALGLQYTGLSIFAFIRLDVYVASKEINSH